MELCLNRNKILRPIKSSKVAIIHVSFITSSSSRSLSFIVITNDNMCEIQPCSYLISKQRFESIYNLARVKPSSHDRWALTGVPHGNLSRAHTEVVTVASHPRILSSLTCARSLTGCFQHAHSPCPQGGGPSQ